MKRIPRFGDTGLSKAKKTLYVSAENTVGDDVVNNEKKYNINKISDEEMKLLGLTKKEIKDIKLLREKGEIRSNIDLKEIFSEKRYREIERSIEFEGE